MATKTYKCIKYGYATTASSHPLVGSCSQGGGHQWVEEGGAHEWTED